ncbi:MAG: glycosyltransferase, partial [Phycisphaerales bacterium]|nr:glycosyltransferase [Phycisphaerales bacterium]
MTETGPHAILATFGTDGDVVPYLGLGAALRRRGHEVTLATVDRYRPAAKQLGLAFASLMSDAEADAVFGHSDMWHPTRGPRMLAAWGGRPHPRPVRHSRRASP